MNGVDKLFIKVIKHLITRKSKYYGNKLSNFSTPHYYSLFLRLKKFFLQKYKIKTKWMLKTAAPSKSSRKKSMS